MKNKNPITHRHTTDIMLRPASRDQVTWAQAEIGKKYRKLAGATQEDPCALFRDEILWARYRKEIEETTIRMGWDPDIFNAIEHEEIMKDLYRES